MNKEISIAIKQVLHQRTWQCKKGHGSFLTLDFGTPIISYLEPKIAKKNIGIYGNKFPFNKYAYRKTLIKGEYHLWIYYTNWKIFVDNIEIAFDNSNGDTIDDATYFIQGQAITKVKIYKQPYKTIFYFDLNTKLECYNNTYEKGKEMWILFSPDRNTITFRNDGKWILTSNNNQESTFEIEEEETEIEI